MEEDGDDSLVIEEFMRNYSGEGFFAYQYCAEKTKEICELRLEEAGIPAVITCRAKKPEPLRQKLERFARERTYAYENDIKQDMVDLAGTRIALYYPNQKAQVGSILWSAFDVDKVFRGDQRHRRSSVQETKENQPYKKRFFDYKGDHYHVRMRLQDLPSDRPYPHLTVEIQVVTVISSAWSQVEHDILYKRLTGTPSKDEYRILDSFNGLVHMGELLLDQLSETRQARIDAENRKFADEYELGSFLRRWLSSNINSSVGDIDLGPVRALFVLSQVEALKIATPRALEQQLSGSLYIKVALGEMKIQNGDKKESHNSPVLLILQGFHKGNPYMAIAARKQTQALLSQGKASQAVAIIASTMLWLNELFPALDWSEILATCKIKDDLRWILRMDQGNESVESIWMYRICPIEKTLHSIGRLWAWLESSWHAEIVFIFDLACLGMLKDPAKGLLELPRLGSYLAFLHVL